MGAKNNFVRISVKELPAEGQAGDAFTETRLMPAFWFSTGLHAEHRRPKAGDVPHEALLKVKRRGFRCLECFGSVSGVFRGVVSGGGFGGLGGGVFWGEEVFWRRCFFGRGGFLGEGGVLGGVGFVGRWVFLGGGFLGRWFLGGGFWEVDFGGRFGVFGVFLLRFLLRFFEFFEFF